MASDSSLQKILYSNLSEGKDLRRVAEVFYTFLATPNEVEKYVELIEKKYRKKITPQSSSFDNCVRIYSIKILNLFYPDLQLINTKFVIKNKLKDLLDELKRFQAQTKVKGFSLRV